MSAHGLLPPRAPPSRQASLHSTSCRTQLESRTFLDAILHVDAVAKEKAASHVRLEKTVLPAGHE